MAAVWKENKKISGAQTLMAITFSFLFETIKNPCKFTLNIPFNLIKMELVWMIDHNIYNFQHLPKLQHKILIEHNIENKIYKIWTISHKNTDSIILPSA